MSKSNFIVRGGANFNPLYQELNKTQKKLGSFQKGVSKSIKKIGAILGSIAIGKLVKDSTQVAMSVESSVDNINRNMQTSAGAFQKWVETQSKSLGMAKADAYKYGSTFSNLLSSFTGSTKETADQTQELMQAAAIIASKTGRTYEDVSERIRSGLLGSTEAIEDLGVYTNISMIESTEAFKRLAGDKSWAQLDFQTQQQIRLAAILEQTYARYGTTLADTTQTRQAQFVASLKDVQTSLGQAFLPIYNAVLPALTAMANAIGRVINLIAQFVTALFGAPKQAQAQASAIQSQANAMKNLGSATTGAGKAAKKAAKDAKGALAPFDEINQLADKTGASSGTGGAGAVGGGGGAAIEMPSMDTGGLASSVVEVSEKVKEMTAKIKTYLEPAIAALGRLKDAFMPLGQNIASGLKWILDNVLIPLGKWTITEVVPRFIDALANVFRILNEVVEALKPLWSWLWENLFLPVAQWTGGVILDILDGINKGLTAIGDWISENQKTVVDSILNSIKDAAISLWENVLKPLGEFLATVFVAAWNAVSDAAGWLWENVLVPFGEFLEWFWNSVLVPIGSVLVDVLGVAFQTVADIAKSFWENVLVPLGNALAEMFGPAVEAVSAVLGFLWNKIFVPLGSFLSSIFKPIIEGLIKVFEFLWKNVLKPVANFMGSVFVTVFDTVFKSIKSIINGIKNIFIGLMNFITGIFTGDWEKAWEGVKKIFKGIWDAFVGIVKIPINLIIDFVNFLIKGLNKISIDVPDWMAKLLGMEKGAKVGFNIKPIPKLAQGGYVRANNPMLAIIGDNRREGEIVAPESKIYEQTLRAIRDAGGSDKPIQLVIKLGSTKFYQEVINGINRTQREMGMTLIEV